jgi:hypothetical protein
MKEIHISAFLLERYKLGEVSAEEKLLVENALARDVSLADSLAALQRADLDFWRRFPREEFFPKDAGKRRARFAGVKGLRRVHPAVWGLCAAAVILVVTIPIFVMRNSAHQMPDDRMKGASAEESSIELNVYLRGKTAGEGIKLADQADIHSGETIQLTYRVQEDASERYGVIFSIDGRASVTMHYPYSIWQSTQLVSGRAVPLDEAYTLDDAPDYEIFFFVVDDEPVETENILNDAKHLAVQIEGKPQEAVSQAASVFKDYQLETLTLRKEQ